MNEKTYVILFKDGAIQLFSQEPEMRHFQKGARLFYAEDTIQIIELCEWASRGYNHKDFIEIKGN